MNFKGMTEQGLQEVLEYSTEQWEIRREEAEANGLTVVEARPDELLLDIDQNYERFQREAKERKAADIEGALAQLIGGIVAREVFPSHSGNTHVYIRLYRELDPETAIFIQVLMGSDPVRELFNMVRLSNKATPNNVLFVTPLGLRSIEAGRAKVIQALEVQIYGLEDTI